MPDLNEVVAELEEKGFDSKKIKAVVVNYPNNPLGATATREYLNSVVEFARKRKILIVSDLAYSEMYWGDQEAPASILEFENAKDLAIEFHSLSKPYSMTGWRLGWACGNKDLVGILNKVKSTVDTGIFKALQKAGSEILLSAEGDKYIKEWNERYRQKQTILLDGFKELGWDIANLNIPQATFYLWLPIPARYKTSEDFTTDLLKTAGIVAVPGTAFGGYGEVYFRLSFVSADDDLRLVIERMKTDGFYFSK